MRSRDTGHEFIRAITSILTPGIHWRRYLRILVIAMLVDMLVMLVRCQIADDFPHGNHKPQRHDNGKGNEKDGFKRDVYFPFLIFLTMTRLPSEITNSTPKKNNDQPDPTAVSIRAAALFYTPARHRARPLDRAQQANRSANRSRRRLMAPCSWDRHYGRC